MGFTAKELSLILAARKRSASSSALRVFLVGAIMIGAFLASNGLIDAEKFAYAAIAAALIAALSPQFNWGPKYEDLIDLLESKLE